MKLLLSLAFFCFLLAAPCASAQPAGKVNWKDVTVLVYTKNGKGYVHDNIPSAVKAIQKLGQEQGFKVDVTDDPAVFTENKLKKYTFLLFPSTNNDVFDTDEQRLAFRRYIEAGGGFVGLHSVTGTERNWKWFKMLVGGTFDWHVPFMSFKINTIEPGHPTMQGLPTVWEREDECYFTKEMYPGINVLMAHDLSSFDQKQQEEIKKHTGSFANYFPAAWYQHFDGGTVWVTTLGHDKKSYQDPTYLRHVLQGMHFVASQSGKLDFKKAYATSRDTPLKFAKADEIN
ncbi:ThuA domain-containing protein [Pontibacter russatus]|uniref:ThuA domain-containing protein n=1 Tax=Pontibacter russatus TaxID=2694929 RepID=UPI00137B7CC8|nr:ThuA domain-containing protein [Pontibacter russatus]